MKKSGFRWTYFPDLPKTDCQNQCRSIGENFCLDLTQVHSVIASKHNPLLFILRYESTKLDICILATSEYERKAWLTALSAVVETSPKPIPILTANALLHCLHTIEAKGGARAEQIFRKNGGRKKTSNLYRALLTSSKKTDKQQWCKESNIYDLASTVKRILERCAETLLTSSLYPKFLKIFAEYSSVQVQSLHKSYEQGKMRNIVDISIAANRVSYNRPQDNPQTIQKVKELLHRLPRMNYCLLKRIIQLCVLISETIGNKMSPNNLAVVIGATILAKGDSTSFTQMRTTIVPVFESFIINSRILFGAEKVELFGAEKDEFFEEKNLVILNESTYIEEDARLFDILNLYSISSLNKLSWPTLKEISEKIEISEKTEKASKYCTFKILKNGKDKVRICSLMKKVKAKASGSNNKNHFTR